MAATPVEVVHGIPGLTTSPLTAVLKLRLIGTPTVVNNSGNGDSLSEVSGDPGTYRATVNDSIAGRCKASMVDGDGAILFTGFTDLADTTDVFTVGDYAVADVDVELSEQDIQDIVDGVADAIGGLGGSRIVTITVTCGAVPVQGANVRIASGSTLIDTGTTNASGISTLAADDGTYTLTISRSGLYSSVTQSLVVSGDTSASVTLSSLTISPSTPPSRTTGYLFCYSEAGVVESGVTISLYMDAPPGSHGLAVDSATRTEVSDANGFVQFADLWKGGAYRLKRGSGNWYSFTVPSNAGASIELLSILGT